MKELANALAASLGIIALVGAAFLAGMGGVHISEYGLPSVGWHIEPKAETIDAYTAARDSIDYRDQQIVYLQAENEWLAALVDYHEGNKSEVDQYLHQRDYYLGQIDNCTKNAAEYKEYADTQIAEMEAELREVQRLNRALQNDVDALLEHTRNLMKHLKEQND